MAISDCPLYVYVVGNFILIINLIVSNIITKHVPMPYMDEIFHVTQAQTYCEGNFTEWNDKITTLPGLYLLNSIPARLGFILFNLNSSLFCSINSLRLTNTILMSFTFILIFKLYNLIHYEEKKGEKVKSSSQSKLRYLVFIF